LGLDRTRWPELMLGLERVRVLEVVRGSDGRLHVAIETTDVVAACRACVGGTHPGTQPARVVGRCSRRRVLS
jgi:hypothetical protein